MRALLIIFLLTAPMSSFAQWGGGWNYNSNSLNLVPIMPWYFYINSASDLENVQTVPYAFKLEVNSSDNKCFISAKISSSTSPAGFSSSSYPLFLDYAVTNAPSYKYSNLLTSPIQLSQSNTKLFNQAQSGTTYDYYYHMKLGPLGYDYIPGNYSWTITFTMTQQ